MIQPEQVQYTDYNFWKPHQKQIQFARIPFSVFESFYGGALGGGKSDLLLMLPILYKLHEHPKFHGIFFRRTLSQQDETLILRAKFLYGKVGATFNEQKRIFTFPAGGVIRYTYLERDEHARDHDGAEYHYVAFDELTHFSEFQYIYITSRIRRSTSELPVIIRSASNPGNVGHAWVRKRFIEAAREGGKILKDIHGNKRIFIKSLAVDNPSLIENDPEYLTRLQLLPEAERKAKIEGDWWIFSGQVFTEFRDSRRVSEPANALHVIPPFRIPAFWPRIMAEDWGWAANTYILWAAISPDARIYIYREYLRNKTSIKTYGADLARITAPEIDSLKTFFLDPSAWKHDDEKSIHDQILEAVGSPLKDRIEKADNDRLSGKQLLHELLRFTPLPEIKDLLNLPAYDEEVAQRIKFKYGEEAYLRYHQSFLPTPTEENLPRLQIFSSCEALISTIPLCIYNESKASRRTKKYEDVAEFNGDDPYDTVRYLVKGCDRYIEEVLRKDKSLKIIQAIEDRREITGDQTSYYMAMAFLEAKQRKEQRFSESRPRTGRFLPTRSHRISRRST